MLGHTLLLRHTLGYILLPWHALGHTLLLGDAGGHHPLPGDAGGHVLGDAQCRVPGRSGSVHRRALDGDGVLVDWWEALLRVARHLSEVLAGLE